MSGATKSKPSLISSHSAWKVLQHHKEHVIDKHHLRQLLQDEQRNQALCAELDGVTMDFSRELVTLETMELLFDLADVADVQGKAKRMAAGDRINTTENRSVLHMALRSDPTDVFKVDGANVVPQVHQVLNKIKSFSESVRSNRWVGVTGKPLTNIVCIGIGGSYLGAEFVYQALRNHPDVVKASRGRQLRFLANVDPVAVFQAQRSLQPENTLVVIISKTFTTAETMLNARSLRHWLVSALGPQAVAKHMVAVSASPDKAADFGIDENNVFGFWDWVGGRYSVCSAVGVLPLSLTFGFDVMQQFLSGARSIDRNFLEASPRANLPLIMGMLGLWNSSFLGHEARAILPYTEALARFPAHIQQVDMESNGKRVSADGQLLPFKTGEIILGEPGTNGQHSFYQLLHQGRVVPAEFIGFCHSQSPVVLPNEVVPNHDELMSNFFAQPDALAVGKTAEELQQEGVAEELIPHKTFPGNRPSMSILFPSLTPSACGQLLSLYEHRVAVQGFVWGVNSFDQWGVELGKVLGKKVRSQLSDSLRRGADVDPSFNSSTRALLKKYLATAHASL